ncbi:MAG: hypothetical protein E4H27_05765 [Anaerolineales bacterium]|nr:MAG: hypothetical protein E4H27_05765 [Anaerolineales bacterium]
MMSMRDIYNYINISDSINTSGQPTEAQLQVAAAEGVQVVINLATLDSKTTLTSAVDLVRAAGMEYFHIPVVWDNPTQEDFAEFKRVMRQNAGKVTLIHCVANYRATAFYALYAMENLGWSETEADALMAKIWQRDANPVWEAFIECMIEKIQTAR